MLKELPALILKHKITIVLIAVFVLIIGGAYFAIIKFQSSNPPQEIVEEINLPFDPNGPFALLIPRRDGNAINLNLKRVGSFQFFSYQVAYADKEGIDRGAGDLNTWIPIEKNQSEFTQEILFGTCSKGDTADPLHCVFDKGVKNGTLNLHFKNVEKINSRLNKAKVYKMSITWHLQKPDVALGKLTSGDEHFVYKTNASQSDLRITAFTIISDLTGIPKLPEGKKILGKVYALNIPLAKKLFPGDVTFEISETPSSGAKLMQYIENENKWEELQTSIKSNTLSAKANGSGIFAVFTNASP